MSDDTPERQEDMFLSGTSQHNATSHGATPNDVPQHDASAEDLASQEQASQHEGHVADERVAGNDEQNENDAIQGYDLAGFVFGALDEEEMARVRAAIAADPKLRSEVQSMESVLTEFALLAPSQQINRGRSAGIRSRLIARAASTRDGRPPTARPSGDLLRPKMPVAEPGAPLVRRSVQEKGAESRTLGKAAESSSPPSGRMHTIPSVARSTSLADLRGDTRTPSSLETRSTTPGGHAHATSSSSQLPLRRSGAIRGSVWVTLAIVLTVIVGGIQEWRLRKEQSDLRLSIASRDSSLTTQVASLQASVIEKDSMIQVLTGPNMRVVDLVSSAAQDPVARMFWDQKSHEWTMRAYKLRAPKPGKTYQVWLIANNNPKPISAGTFEPDAQGNAVFHAKYELAKGAFVQVAVSEEPVGGVPEPTGPIIIAGK